MYWQVRGTDLLRHLMLGSCEDRRRPRACYPQEQPTLSGWHGNMPQTLSFAKKRYTDEDCSLVLALLNGEHGLRGRGSGPCSGAACGGRAVGWACVPHIDCLVHDSALRG
jgi:hypothetical protein